MITLPISWKRPEYEKENTCIVTKLARIHLILENEVHQHEQDDLAKRIHKCAYQNYSTYPFTLVSSSPKF